MRCLLLKRVNFTRVNAANDVVSDEDVSHEDATSDYYADGVSDLSDSRQSDEDEHICLIVEYLTQYFLSAHMYHTQFFERYDDGVNHAMRCGDGIEGLMRNYVIWNDERVVDIPLWLSSQFNLLESCLSPLIALFDKPMLYMRVNFIRVSAERGDVVSTTIGDV